MTTRGSASRSHLSCDRALLQIHENSAVRRCSAVQDAGRRQLQSRVLAGILELRAFLPARQIAIITNGLRAYIKLAIGEYEPPPPLSGRNRYARLSRCWYALRCKISQMFVSSRGGSTGRGVGSPSIGDTYASKKQVSVKELVG